jgi:hypothetical protein
MLMRPGQNRDGLRAALRAMLLKATGARELLPPGKEIEPAPLGCEMWAKYLLDLESMREFGELEITAEEMNGLLLGREVRRQFDRDFVMCPECGEWTRRGMKICGQGHSLRN